ncbi:DUF2141 domain-containing protein [Chitinophaga vietnamensis]|uniref:DUF2141 domain-containing protein n=1 Tax=Chitinophaga vietnamensis TaxID=2593957 RepID=UPI001177EE9A|nr:DUF2141 domain-containing protein [Chitinophaga vietnamensis]
MMFQIFKMLAIAQLLFATNLPPDKTYRLELNVHNIMISKGKIYVAIYNNEKEFMKNPYLKKSVPVEHFMSEKIVFDNLPEGDYCVTIYQDLNENAKLDKTLNMPTEPYGLSNNPNAFPTYENTRFHINKDTAIRIKLKN